MSDNNTKDTKNLKNAYFVTLDNISTYDNGDTLTMEDAIAKIQLNWNLSSKEKSLEKKTMLLNNCIITINQIQERLPEEYVVPAYVAILECLLKQNLVSEAMDYLTDVCSFLEEESDEIPEAEEAEDISEESDSDETETDESEEIESEPEQEETTAEPEAPQKFNNFWSRNY